MTGFYASNGYYSPDGSSWSPAGASGQFAYAPDLARLVCVGYSGDVRISDDGGATWTNHPSALWQPAGSINNVSGTGSWASVAWVPSTGKFIAVGDYGSWAESPDGVTWTDLSTNDDYRWQEVKCASDGLHVTAFCYFQDYSYVYDSKFSSDGGATWVSPASGKGSAAYSPELERWVASTQDSFGLTTLSTSPDGVTWTDRVARSSVGRVIWAPGEGKFVAVGSDTANNPDMYVAYSPDGIAWTFVNISTVNNQLTSVAYSPDLDLFVATDIGGWFTSPNAATWSTRRTGVYRDVVWVDTNRPPNAPIPTSPISGSVDRSNPIDLKATFSDPDPNDAPSASQWRYRATGAPTWTTVTQNNTLQSYSIPAGLAAGDYEWQAAYADQAGAWGPFCLSSFFTAGDPPPGPVWLDPINGQTISTASYTGVISQASLSESEWTLYADNAGAIDTTTVLQGPVAVTTGELRRHTFTGLANNTPVWWSVRAKDAGLWSQPVQIRTLTSYTTPEAPVVTVSADAATGSLLVTITNPTPGAGVPATSYNEVYVDDGDGEERRATFLAPNMPWRYWTPVSGRDYSAAVRVVAVGDNGTTSSSS